VHVRTMSDLEHELVVVELMRLIELIYADVGHLDPLGVGYACCAKA